MMTRRLSLCFYLTSARLARSAKAWGGTPISHWFMHAPHLWERRVMLKVEKRLEQLLRRSRTNKVCVFCCCVLVKAMTMRTRNIKRVLGLDLAVDSLFSMSLLDYIMHLNVC